jgi:hypothetical protein
LIAWVSGLQSKQHTSMQPCITFSPIYERPQFRDPHDRLVTAVPPRSEMRDLGWPRIYAVNEPLAIDADTIACEWDGRPVDYGAIVGHLVVADDLR